MFDALCDLYHSPRSAPGVIGTEWQGIRVNDVEGMESVLSTIEYNIGVPAQPAGDLIGYTG